MIIIEPYKVDINIFINKNTELLKDTFFNLLHWIDINPDLDRFLDSKSAYVYEA